MQFRTTTAPPIGEAVVCLGVPMFSGTCVRTSTGPGREDQTQVCTVGGAITVDVTAGSSPSGQSESKVCTVDDAITVEVAQHASLDDVLGCDAVDHVLTATEQKIVELTFDVEFRALANSTARDYVQDATADGDAVDVGVEVRGHDSAVDAVVDRATVISNLDRDVHERTD